MNYLARLKARSGRKHVPDELPKLTKRGFVGFDSDPDGHFLQAANASDQPEGGPTMDYLARLKARSEEKHIPDEPTKPTKPSQEGKEVGFVGFDGDLGGRFPQASSIAATRRTEHLATGWTDPHEERASNVEYDGGAPPALAEGFARLDPARPPDDVPQRRWRQFIDDCGTFLDSGWPTKATALGWGAADLFGCDRLKPFARVDRLGLLWLLNGRRIVALTADSATIETASGGRLTYRRVPNDRGRVLAWSMCGGGDR
jgi:hypothetical protein